MSLFRPCIDLHEGKVKQIVGSTLSDSGDAPLSGVTSYHGKRIVTTCTVDYQIFNVRIILGQHALDGLPDRGFPVKTRSYYSNLHFLILLTMAQHNQA